MSKIRHSLSNESIWVVTAVGSWCLLPDAIPQNEIITLFKEKSKQPKGKQLDPIVVVLSEPKVTDSDGTDM